MVECIERSLADKYTEMSVNYLWEGYMLIMRRVYVETAVNKAANAGLDL